jgi:cytidylate kinase
MGEPRQTGRSDFGGFPPDSPLHGFRGDRPAIRPGSPIPAGVTIAVSREAGARGGTIGRRVARKIGWQVYDQELIEFLAHDPSAQQNLQASLPDDAARWVAEQHQRLLEERGMEPTPAVVNLLRLVLSLGTQGNVVLIGRGAGFLLPRASTLHVRLFAPVEERVSYMSQWLRLTREEARQRVLVRDARREEFLVNYLRCQPGDLYSHDLLLSTSLLGEELCVDLVVQAALSKARAIGPGSSESEGLFDR